MELGRDLRDRQPGREQGEQPRLRVAQLRHRRLAHGDRPDLPQPCEEGVAGREVAGERLERPVPRRVVGAEVEEPDPVVPREQGQGQQGAHPGREPDRRAQLGHRLGVASQSAQGSRLERSEVGTARRREHPMVEPRVGERDRALDAAGDEFDPHALDDADRGVGRHLVEFDLRPSQLAEGDEDEAAARAEQVLLRLRGDRELTVGLDLVVGEEQRRLRRRREHGEDPPEHGDDGLQPPALRGGGEVVDAPPRPLEVEAVEGAHRRGRAPRRMDHVVDECRRLSREAGEKTVGAFVVGARGRGERRPCEGRGEEEVPVDVADARLALDVVEDRQRLREPTVVDGADRREQADGQLGTPGARAHPGGEPELDGLGMPPGRRELGYGPDRLERPRRFTLWRRVAVRPCLPALRLTVGAHTSRRPGGDEELPHPPLPSLCGDGLAQLLLPDRPFADSPAEAAEDVLGQP